MLPEEWKNALIQAGFSKDGAKNLMLMTIAVIDGKTKLEQLIRFFLLNSKHIEKYFMGCFTEGYLITTSKPRAQSDLLAEQKRSAKRIKL